MSSLAAKKLVFIIRDLGHGGAQRQLSALARGLHESGKQVCVVCFYTGFFAKELEVAGVPCVQVPKKGRWDIFGFFWRLMQTVRKLRPELVHGYLNEGNLMATFLVPFTGFPRLIWGVRDSQTDAGTWGWLGKTSFWLNRLCSRFPNKIILNSHAGREYYEKQGYPKERMVVIPNGLNTDYFAPQPGSKKGNLFGIIGRFHPMKGHEIFLRAIAEVPDAKGLIVGSGDPLLEKTLRELAEKLGVAQRIEWRSASTDLRPIHAELDGLVSSSIYGEGFSNVIGEAMSSGVPCIASDVGDSAWLLGSPDWVFPPGDVKVLAEKMRAFLALSQEQRAALSSQARKRVAENFTLRNLILRTSEVLYPSYTHTRILWITSGLGSGGAERVLTQLICGLSSAEHHVISLTKGGKYEAELKQKGTNVHSLDFKTSFLMSSIAFVRLIRHIGPDTIMGWMYHGCAAAVMAKVFTLGRAKVMWNIRQSLYDLNLERPASAQLIQILPYFCWSVDCITYNSKTSARQHEEAGFSRKLTRLIPNGFDLNLWSPAPKSPTRSTLKLGRLGRYTTMKDYPTLLDAIVILKKKVPNAAWIFAGAGMDTSNQELAIELEKRGLQGQIELLGDVKDVPTLTASLDIAVSSSLAEAFPNVVGEAMSCAVPVVATDVGDTAWLLGSCGRLVPPRSPEDLAQACEALLSLPESERYCLGLAARERIASHFQLHQMVTLFADLLQLRPS